MDKILYILSIKKRIKIKLDVNNEEFIELIKKDIKPEQSIFLDIFDNDKKKFYGKINGNEFKIRLCEGVFRKTGFASAHGKILGTNKKTELEISLLGWNWFISLWSFGMLIFIGFLIYDIITHIGYGGLIIIVPFLLFFISLFLIMMNYGIKQLEKYLIAELT